MKGILAILSVLFFTVLSLFLIAAAYLTFSGELGVLSSETATTYEVPRYFGYIAALLAGVAFFFAINLLRKAFPSRFK